MSDHHLPFFSSHLRGSSAVECVRFRCGAFCEFSSVSRFSPVFRLRWLIQFAPFWRLPIKPFCLDKARHALELVTRLCPLHHESPFTHFSHFLHAPFCFFCHFAICISLNSLLILLDFFSHFPSLYFCNIFISYDFHFQFFSRFHFALCKYLSTLLLMLFMRMNAVECCCYCCFCCCIFQLMVRKETSPVAICGHLQVDFVSFCQTNLTLIDAKINLKSNFLQRSRIV